MKNTVKGQQVARLFAMNYENIGTNAMNQAVNDDWDTFNFLIKMSSVPSGDYEYWYNGVFISVWCLQEGFKVFRGLMSC